MKCKAIVVGEEYLICHPRKRFGKRAIVLGFDGYDGSFDGFGSGYASLSPEDKGVNLAVYAGQKKGWRPGVCKPQNVVMLYSEHQAFSEQERQEQVAGRQEHFAFATQFNAELEELRTDLQAVGLPFGGGWLLEESSEYPPADIKVYREDLERFLVILRASGLYPRLAAFGTEARAAWPWLADEEGILKLE